MVVPRKVVVKSNMGDARKIYFVISTLNVLVTKCSYTGKCHRQENCAKNRNNQHVSTISSCFLRHKLRVEIRHLVHGISMPWP